MGATYHPAIQEDVRRAVSRQTHKRAIAIFSQSAALVSGEKSPIVQNAQFAELCPHDRDAVGLMGEEFMQRTPQERREIIAMAIVLAKGAREKKSLHR